jgi:streptogramin lyase
MSLLFSFLCLEGPFETGTSAYSRRKRIFVNSLFLALFLIANGAWNLGQAQTAIFSGAYSSVPTSTLNYAYGTAVDSSGTVYITNSGFGQVLKETLSADGTYTEGTIGSGFYFPTAIVVDATGNIYIADTDNNRVVKETLSGGTYVQSTIGSGLNLPYGIAVDNNGNVYIADTGNRRVLEEIPSGGSYTQSTIISNMRVTSVAVDASGNLYLCDSNNQQVFKETLSAGTYTQSTIATGIGGPSGLAVNSEGVVFIADDDTASAGRVLEEIPTSSGYQQVVLYTGTIGTYGIAIDWQNTLYTTNIYSNQVLKAALAGANFGSVKIGTPSASIPLTFIFGSSGTIGAPMVLTAGATGLDFADAGTGTCTTNGTSHTYNAGDSCTVNVVFTPRASGSRYGAVQLQDSSSNVIATGYVQGIGVGPQVAFLPGTQSTIVSSSGVAPFGVAIDASGSLYVTDFGHQRVVKETPSGGGYNESIVASTAPQAPSNVALDGSGNVYVRTPGGVLKETPSGNGYVQSMVTTNGFLAGMTVDGYGDVYVTDYEYSRVLKETPSPAGYLESTIPTNGLLDPFGIAVDGSGNLYIADPNNLRVVKETLSGGTYTQSTIPATGLTGDAQWIAVDSNSNVYISDFGAKQVLKETPSGGSYVQSTVPASGLASPAGVAIDGRGNVYIADTNNVFKEDFADAPSLNFATTAPGATSADSPKTVTLENVGNSNLTFPSLSNENNPNISQSFVLNSNASSACPVVDTGSSTAGTLAAGVSCELSISFVPRASGTISGSLVLTDTALNAGAPSYATQSISLSGTGTQATPTSTLTSSANPAFLSNTVTFTAAVTAAAGTPTGTVSFYDGSTLLGTAALTSGSAAFTTSSLAVGMHSITAAYSGDSNFKQVTSNAVSETIEDFTLSVVGSGSATASKGGQPAYTLSIAPPSGATLAGGVSLTVSGLPAGATASFSPATVPAGSGSTNVTLRVTLSNTAALERLSYPLGGGLTMALGWVLLPFSGKRSRFSKSLTGILCWTAIGLVGAAIALGVAGCSSGGSGTQPQTYTLTVTANSGSLSHATTLNLTVN